MRRDLPVCCTPVFRLHILFDDYRICFIEQSYTRKIIPGGQDPAFFILDLLRFGFMIRGQILFDCFFIMFQNHFLAYEHLINDAAEPL